METCYSGIAIPTPESEPCNGDYKSTDCVLSPDALTYLGLPANTSQSDINAAVQASLIAKEQLISEIPISDGTETKIIAGPNVIITGTGTIPDPYIVESASTLQSVLDINPNATVVDNTVAIYADVSFDEERTSTLSISGFQVLVSNRAGNISSEFSINDGLPSILISDSSDETFNTSVLFEVPIAATGLIFPAKENPGNYTLATLDDIPNGGVESITGAIVDNTDPLNPTINLEGYTESGTRAGGDLIVKIGDYNNEGHNNRILIDDYSVNIQSPNHFLFCGVDQIGISSTNISGDYGWVESREGHVLITSANNGTIQIKPSLAPPIAINSSGIPGEIRFDSDYMYRCISPDTWRRVALSTW